MKVVITKSAEDGLEAIFNFKCEYSAQHAAEFVIDISDFAMKNLSEFPELGHVYNAEKSLYRLVYSKSYNIYYTISSDQVDVLYIIDSALSLNERLSEPGLQLPDGSE